MVVMAMMVVMVIIVVMVRDDDSDGNSMIKKIEIYKMLYGFHAVKNLKNINVSPSLV